MKNRIQAPRPDCTTRTATHQLMTVLLPLDLHDGLTQTARRQGVTKSVIIRTALTKAVENGGQR